MPEELICSWPSNGQCSGGAEHTSLPMPLGKLALKYPSSGALFRKPRALRRVAEQRSLS